MNNDKENKSLWQGLKAKGYYIALILCACAIGISGYVYYRSSNKSPATEETTIATVATTPAGLSRDGDPMVPAIGTGPTIPQKETTPSTTPTEPEKPQKTMWPVEGEAVAAYAMDKLTFNETTKDWRVHNGVDLAAAAGTQVRAAADGQVYTVYNDDLMGTTVVIRHVGGYLTTYASLAEDPSVKAGDSVKCGDTIGVVGTTALCEKALDPHVHFSVTCNDKPVDPEQFLE